MKTLDYRSERDPAPQKPMGHRLPRFVVEGIFFLILTPILCMVDGTLVVYLAFNLPPNRAWIIWVFAYPGALFSNEYTAFVINGVCWAFGVIFCSECVIQVFESSRAKTPKNSGNSN
jgi:hypothetical protein